MSILCRNKIIEEFKSDNLIKNPRKKITGEYDVEGASYDLMIGEIIWKRGTRYPWANKIGHEFYDSGLPPENQKSVTLQPGQMLFVITHEDVKLPNNMCATVYSRNRLSREGILALNAGHIDPGFQGPIVIRLINLRSTTYTIKIGEPIFTIVFDTLKYNQNDILEAHPEITREQTVRNVFNSADTALTNALYDLSLMHNFINKEEFGSFLFRWLTRSFWGIITFIISVIIASIALGASLITIINFLEANNAGG